MAATVEGFLVHFPEFANAGTAMLTAQLAQTEIIVSDGFAEQRDLVVYLRLADLLATSPSGRDARMTAKDSDGEVGSSVYRKRYDELCAAYAVNALRFGVLP